MSNSACSGVKWEGDGCSACTAAWSGATAESGDLMAMAAAVNLVHTATNWAGTRCTCCGSQPRSIRRHWLQKVRAACGWLSGTAPALQFLHRRANRRERGASEHAKRGASAPAARAQDEDQPKRVLRGLQRLNDVIKLRQHLDELVLALEEAAE